MAEFVVNQDVATEQPTVEVTLSLQRPLAVGRHRFRLIVLDNSGNRSAPDEIDVVIADTQAPTAVLTPLNPVPFGTSFNLDGRRSTDVGGGQITRYVWTYLGPSPR